MAKTAVFVALSAECATSAVEKTDEKEAGNERNNYICDSKEKNGSAFGLKI